jgi:hypothetical protein
MDAIAAIDVSEERRLRRLAGDPRISPKGRATLARITDGDLADEFQAALEAALDAALDADPPLGGHPAADD